MSSQADCITGQIFVLKNMTAEAQFSSVLVGTEPAKIDSVQPDTVPGRKLEVSFPAHFDDDGEPFRTEMQETLVAFVDAVSQTK